MFLEGIILCFGGELSEHIYGSWFFSHAVISTHILINFLRRDTDFSMTGVLLFTEFLIRMR